MNIHTKLIQAPLAAYRNRHELDTIVVCGCGHSLSQFTPTADVVTVGVNDVGRLFTTDYLVVLNPESQFKAGRFQFVKSTQANTVFTQLNLGITHKNVVRFKLGRRGGTEITDDLCVPYTRNSPYVALCLAMFMGAKKIGLIGVDFTDHHFFANTGKHILEKNLHRINQEYEQLNKVALKNGVQILNLSSESRLTAFPKIHMNTFFAGAENVKAEVTPNNQAHSVSNQQLNTLKSLNIVSYATTPVAGVPELLARCINKHTIHHCDCVWQNNAYANGVSFESAIEWNKKPDEAKRRLAAADLVIVHNGKVAHEHIPLLANKVVITMAHNYLWNVDQQFVARGMPGVVVGQYQATLPEFSGWTSVSNPIPEWDQFHQPLAKNKTLTICYTPSGKHERYPQHHRLYWHSKGYESTMAILENLAKRFDIKLNVIRDKQLSHAQVLRMKQQAHIVIDECVTGSYHRNSLEGLACGCVVINGMDAKVEQALKHCVGLDSVEIPFVTCKLDMLEHTLTDLIQLGTEELIVRGQKNRRWLEHYWSFERQWYMQWQPVIETAIQKQRGVKEISIKAKITSSEKQQTAIPTTKTSSLAIAKKIHPGPLPVYWTCRTGKRGNFGDMLSPILVKSMSERPVVFKQNSPRLFAVGSLLKFAQAGDIVWGAGFIHENDRAHQGIDLRAVRGPLTRDILLAQGIACPEIYGDPGLLLPVIYDQPVQKKYQLGIIPHYVDLPLLRKLLPSFNKKQICIIDIRAGVDEVIKMTRQCEIILSSSLHGIILAEAYGIPAAWVEISDKVVGNGFKFHDYYASTNRQAPSLDWRKAPDLQVGMQAAISLPAPEIDLQRLVAAFPFLETTKFNNVSLPQKLCINMSTGKLQAIETSSTIVNSVVDFDLAATETLVPPDKHSGNGKTEKSTKRLCIYGSATEDYAEFLVASLRSFINHNGHTDTDYYILGNNFSMRTRRLMNRFGIRYLNINLSDAFARYIRHRYPSECFWIFKGPELFDALGYQYSLAVDGDTLCYRKLELNWLNELEHIAGVYRGCTTGAFLKNINQLEPVKHKLGLLENNLTGPATNSGVLFFNNRVLASLEFFKRAVEAFRRSENAGIPRAGDDSTLALILGLNPELRLHLLPDDWNIYRGLVGEKIAMSMLETANIIHLSALKPWLHHQRWPNVQIKQLVEEWRKYWPNSKTQRRILVNGDTQLFEARKTPIPRPLFISEIHKETTALPVELYWYRGSTMNVGDEVVPYLIPKILNLNPQLVPAQPVSDPRNLSREVLISVGSVLRLCAKNSLVWGAGIRNIDQEVAAAKQFCAVRGPLTHQRLQQLGHSCPAIFGDPALLLPRYFQPVTTKKYRLGIVPHLVDYPEMQKRLAASSEILLVDVRTNNVERIIEQIASCSAILSSSLHGIIFSIAYGIPARWLKISNRIMGDDCKFYDFFASLEPKLLDDFDFSKVEITAKNRWCKYTPLQIKDKCNFLEISNDIDSIQNTLDEERLLAAFPFERFVSLKKSA
jgi:hypothetical protein